MSDATYAEIARLLPAGPPLCLTTHESPDGDAIGSLLGAGLALESAGRDVRLYLAGSTPMPHEYGFLPLDRIEREPPADLEQRELWAFDCGSARRIGPDAGLLERPLRIVNIDHHHDNTRFGALDLVDAEAACTAQIVERLLREAAIAISTLVAEALYVGLVTDTGRFQYSNTTPEAFRLAARLVDAGAEPATGLRARSGRPSRSPSSACSASRSSTRGSRSRAAARDLADARRLPLRRRRRAVLRGRRRPPARRRGRRGRGARARAARARRAAHKVSLRGRDAGVDVSKIARGRGGGGHVGAAGFTSDETIPEIVEFLRASVT